MQTQHVVLIYRSRLMHELLKCALEQITDVEVVRESKYLEDAANDIGETGAEWLFVILSPHTYLSKTRKAALFLQYPQLRLLSLWQDGSRIKFEWHGAPKMDLLSPTLDELKALLDQNNSF